MPINTDTRSIAGQRYTASVNTRTGHMTIRPEFIPEDSITFDVLEHLPHGEEALDNGAVTVQEAAERRYTHRDVAQFYPASFGMSEYVAKLKEAAGFLRTNSSGRYSDRTHGRFLRKAEAAERTLISRAPGFDPELNLPGVFIIEEPFAYDEDTEVKTGGIIAVALVDQSLTTSKNAIYMAVRQPSRRRAAGSALVQAARRNYGQLTTYVNGANKPGLMFALCHDFNIVGYDSNNCVTEMVRY